MVSGVIRCGELESEVRFPRIRIVPRQPIRSDFSGIGFPGFFRHAEIASEVRSPRMRIVARQSIPPDFIEKTFPKCFESWRTRIRGPFALNQSGCYATDTPGFHRKGLLRGFWNVGTRICVPFFRKLIGRPVSNENRVCGKQAFQRYLDAGNMSSRSADRGY